MKLLLDTHVLLWAVGLPDRLSEELRRELEVPENKLLFSAASIWEIIIKNGLGRPDFQVDARVFRRTLLDNDYAELPVQSGHVLALEELPRIHKDPFDRILIAQARMEEITLLTSDSEVAQYEGPVRLA